MISLRNTKDLMQGNLRARLPILLLALIGLGNALFAVTAIVPPLRAHAELVSDLDASQQALADRVAQQDQQNGSRALNAQISSAQARLEKASSQFWTELQVNSVVDRLYGYAEASGVKITNLQAVQPAAQNKQVAKIDAYDSRTFRLQVDGTAEQLVNFVARIREATIPSVTISNLSIGKGNGQNTLVMNLSLLTSPYASGEVFASLPLVSTPTPIPPSATPITPSPTPTALPPSPTPSVTPTSTRTPIPSPTPTLPAPTATVVQKCSDQSAQTMRRVAFAQVQAASAACQAQVWSFVLDRAYEFVVDTERRSGDGQYRLELRDSNNNIVTTAPSSIDGRGILVAKTGAGSYTVNVVPVSASGDWAYSIALWKGIPSLSFSFTQSSYSSHTSLGAQATITRWHYVLNNSQSYRVQIVRTDGNLEYALVVRDSNGKQLASVQSDQGNASVDLSTGAGTFFVEVSALDGTSGSYRISLVP